MIEKEFWRHSTGIGYFSYSNLVPLVFTLIHSFHSISIDCFELVFELKHMNDDHWLMICLKVMKKIITFSLQWFAFHFIHRYSHSHTVHDDMNISSSVAHKSRKNVTNEGTFYNTSPILYSSFHLKSIQCHQKVKRYHYWSQAIIYCITKQLMVSRIL